VTAPPVTFVRRTGSRTAPAAGTLLETARAAALPIASSCRGLGICDACLVVVTEGEENLTPKTEAERRFSLGPGERLACQASAVGPVTITARYW
jgi:ferredoxin